MVNIAEMPKYEAYKSSGAEWLRDIPNHWSVAIAKHVLMKLDRPRKKNGNTVVCSNHGYSKLLGDVNQGLVSLTQHDYQGVNTGDLLIHGMDAWHGAIAISKHIGDCTSVVHVCDSKHNKTYIAYYLKVLAIRNVYKVISNGVRQNTSDFRSWSKFGDIQILLPTGEEQTLIASFLDKKTAQIDEAIAIKEQQISLLKERKQIIIQQAVTQGLDPNVPMKDSGVEWIGEIPEHWEVKKLRYLGVTQNGISAGAEYFGEGFPFVSYGDVYKNRQLPELVNGLAKSSNGDQKQYSVLAGDVFFTRTSETVDEIGFASICFRDIEKATFAGFLIRFRPCTDLLITEFSKYYFNAAMLRNYFVKEMNLVIRASLSQELLKNLFVALPPASEQLEIYKYLEKKSDQIEEAISIQVNQIEKLKEYKTTLINSAVTGKIKITPEMVE